MKKVVLSCLALLASAAFAASTPGGLYRIPDPNCAGAQIQVASVCSVNTNCRFRWDPQVGFSMLTWNIREQGEGFNPLTPATLNAVHSSDATNPQQFAFTTTNGMSRGLPFTPTFHAIGWANAIGLDDAEYYGNGNVDFPAEEGQFDLLVTRIRGDRLNVRADYVCQGVGSSAHFVIEVQ
jgi:hypothetical protein